MTASAHDDRGIVGVQLRLDNAPLAEELPAPPYTASWNTTRIANGTHVLTAVARDMAGNVATSEAIHVTVANATDSLPVATVEVVLDHGNILPGAHTAAHALARAGTGDVLSGRTIAWSSANEAIAVVSPDGRVSGIAAGTVRLTASSEGKSGGALVAVGLVFRQLAVGGDHVCAIAATDEQAYCWGGNGSGQLGDGTNVSRSEPAPVFTTQQFARLVSGRNGTCGLVASGEAWCWGRGTDADGATSAFPVIQAGGMRFLDIALEEEQICGVSGAGALYCWGGMPIQVGSASNYVHVSAAGKTACTIDATNLVACFGPDNAFGELGNNSGQPSTVPAPLETGLHVLSVSVADGHSCAMSVGLRAACWGSSFMGRTGDWHEYSGSPTVLLSLGDVTDVSAGPFISCAVTTDHSAWCWGSNAYGELGSPSSQQSSYLPLRVSGGHHWSTVAGGWTWTCGLTTDGAVYCWGLSPFGALGSGPLENSSSVPLKVALQP